MKRIALVVALLIGTAPSLSAQSDADRAAINELLDGFAQAAAQGDQERYLGYFTEDGVFFGTDPEERWPLEEFRPYVASRFRNGSGWTYVPRDRSIFFGPHGATAWFDEAMDSPGGTEARGTGVVVRTDDGWKVAQYNFSIPFPNSLWDQILMAIQESKGAQ